MDVERPAPATPAPATPAAATPAPWDQVRVPNGSAAPPRSYRNGVYCTAGTSYFVLAPNGDAFFCMTDLEAGRRPAFNVRRDGWAPRNRPYRCSFATCSGCDFPYVTRWVQDAAGATADTLPRTWPHVAVQNPDPAETPDDLSGRTRSLTWLPSQICNFTCAYCDYGNGKGFTLSRYPMAKDELGVEAWIAAWTGILEHVDYAAVTISGGEPTLSPALWPVMELIAGRFLVNMTTNGSQNMLRLARRLPPKRMVPHPTLGQVAVGVDQINMSLHPSSRSFDLEVFRGNALMLKNAGFNVMVNYVGYPPQLFLAVEHKEWCERNGIPFMLLEWGAGDRYGNVAAYTDAERDFFDRHVTHDRRANAAETTVIRQEIVVDQAAVRVSRNQVLSVTGAVTNNSDHEWVELNNGRGVRIGARLWKAKEGGDNWRERLEQRNQGSLLELRHPLPGGRLAASGTAPFSFAIDCAKLEPGSYELSIDTVDDGKYWHQQIGAMPKVVTFHVS